MSAGSVRFDRAAGFYDATRGYPPGIDAEVAAALLRAGALGRDSRVLEIGIGTGRIARPLAPHVDQIHGVDLSRPMLEQLVAQRGHAPIHVAIADASRLPLASSSYDVAVAVHVFHLIPGWRDVLVELTRVLRPGALLLNAGDEAGTQGSFWEELHGSKLGSAMRDVGVPRERLETFPEDEGWRPAGEILSVPFTHSMPLRDYLAQVETRSWSATWRLSDDQLAELVDRVRTALLERFGSLDHVFEASREFRVRGWHPPGSGSR
jgi:SAM-dependent methyltransferase